MICLLVNNVSSVKYLFTSGHQVDVDQQWIRDSDLGEGGRREEEEEWGGGVIEGREEQC